MKIKSVHYSFLKDRLAAIPKEKITNHVMILQAESPVRIKDLNKRVRWDMLHYAVGSQWICDNLYPYLNDSHIDTALKNVLKELKIKI